MRKDGIDRHDVNTPKITMNDEDEDQMVDGVEELNHTIPILDDDDDELKIGDTYYKLVGSPKRRAKTTPKQQLLHHLKDNNNRKKKKAAVKKVKKSRSRRQKAKEVYREALGNVKDTITLVAILISTFTYSAGLNPPGGVHQDGPLIGNAVAAKRTSFRIFSVCNNVALFTSISVVLVLVSIIPFKRRAVLRMASIAHKAVWVAVSFMATAYVAAGVVIMRPPSGRRGVGWDWTTVFLVSISAGSLGSVFVGLGVMLLNHTLSKRKRRNENKKLETSNKEEQEQEDYSSSFSDMDVSEEQGYHSY